MWRISSSLNKHTTHIIRMPTGWEKSMSACRAGSTSTFSGHLHTPPIHHSVLFLIKEPSHVVREFKSQKCLLRKLSLAALKQVRITFLSPRLGELRILAQ